MMLFRLFLAAILVAILSYTAVTISTEGFNLLPIFFGDMAAMKWPGQFNLDFMCFLLLSGIWVAWRHHFSAAGLVLAVLASVGGSLFLSVYLLVVSFQTRGEVPAILLGQRRAVALARG